MIQALAGSAFVVFPRKYGMNFLTNLCTELAFFLSGMEIERLEHLNKYVNWCKFGFCQRSHGDFDSRENLVSIVCETNSPCINLFACKDHVSCLLVWF
jgi:hypothetical protein